ncbi:MAG: hypothetical protein FJY97_04205 [candidate division Zixibacteria bacterium]|nr:hypothetical protein [candidate division Zixibacteria bacterium]
MTPHFLFLRASNLETAWPFVPERLIDRLGALGRVSIVNDDTGAPLSSLASLDDVDGIAYFGGPTLTDACVAAAPRLKMVGAVADNGGFGLPVEALFARHIPIIDSTRGWAPSVAELGLCLALCALRRVPWWHARMTAEAPEIVWDYESVQYCDDSRFVNGNLGSKRVGIVGLGQIGRRVAAWCHALGAQVVAYDPFAPDATFAACGGERANLDPMMETVDLLFITVPPTPSAERIVSRERVYRLRAGSIVVVVTRAHGIDMGALRERICAGELMGAFDVYDVEPVLEDDPLLGRDNVIHVPHIAGRTRDSNRLVADIIAEDFARILKGETPLARLTQEMIDVRTMRKEVPV